MTYVELLNRIIHDGIEEVKVAYQKPENHYKRDGAIAGFEACRGKTPRELLDLLDNANADVKMARATVRLQLSAEQNMHIFWKARAKEAQIEWVCNVLSAGLAELKLPPLLPGMPTSRAYMKYAEIVGVNVNPVRIPVP